MKFSDHFIDQRVIIRAGGAPQTQPIVVAARNATPRDRSWLTFSGQVWHGGAVSTEHRVAETTTFSTSRPSNRRRLRRQLVRNVHFHMVGNSQSPSIVTEVLKHSLSQSDQRLNELRVLDLGAGNGIVGEELKALRGIEWVKTVA